ncbi:MAG: alpha/beta hydrolase [Candidatus Electrothrix sp. YB6]
MKAIIIVFRSSLSTLLFLALSGCCALQSDGRTDNTHKNQLILADGSRFEVSELSRALDSIMDTFPEGKKKNIVMFVHGRGGGKVKHPEKAIKQMLPFIESEYNIKVVLFNWAGSDKGGPVGFPGEEARAASDIFFHILKQLDTYKQKNSGRLKGIRFSLLTHSMGSIVIEETIDTYSDEIKPDLVDVLVLSSSASKSKGHSKWLNKAALAKHVFVTLNDNDSALKKAGILRGRRLGKGLKNSETSMRAQYIDLSNTGVGHRYFIAHTKNGTKNGQKSNPCISEFYKAALNGTPIDLTSFPGTQEVRQERGFMMKPANGDVCR